MAAPATDKLRILHLADVHLDTPFYGREDSVRNKLRRAALKAFSAAVDCAIDRGVHGLLIAGDLFDNDLLSFTTEKFLLDQASRLRDAGIPVFYATGNHDPGRSNYRAHRLKWPENVRLFHGNNPETVRIGDAGWLTSAGHSARAEHKNIASNFGPAGSGLPHVAMLHTQVVSAAGADQHDRYAPCGYEDLAGPGFDYWALGHVHLRQKVFEDLPAWYAGNLQGRNPRETGCKGALYAEIEKGAVPEPEFVPLSPVVWDSIEVECPAGAVTLDDLVSSVASESARKLQLDDGHEHLVRIDLSGQSALARELSSGDNILEIEKELAARLNAGWLEVRARGISRPVDIEAYRGGATVLGEALELIKRAPGDDALIRKIRPPHLVRKREDEKAYLRALLEGAEHLIAGLLVPEERQ